MMTRRVSLWQWIGAAGACVTLIGSVLVVIFARSGAGWTGRSSLVFGALGAVAGVALWASLSSRPGWLSLAFAASFFPVGLYLGGVPGPAHWLGLAVSLYLVAAVGIFVRGRRGNP